MPADCTDPHFRTLRDRYSDRFIAQAATRRAHLDYKSLRIPDGPGVGKVRFLLAQMHQNYYFGYFETACILSGIILEQALVYKLSRWIKERGPVRFELHGQDVWIKTRDEILELELVDLVRLVQSEKILREEGLLLRAHQIRWIRNMVIHERTPQLSLAASGDLAMKVVKSRRRQTNLGTVQMPAAEVVGLAGKGKELTAYFCVTRLRDILTKLLYEETKKNGESTDEDRGSLFRGQE